MSEVSTESVSDKQLDRKDLKIMAYQQNLAEAEEKLVDMRVELTFASSQMQEMAKRLKEYEDKEADAPKSEEKPDA